MAMNANGGTITYSIKVDPSGAVTGIKQSEAEMKAASSDVGEKSGNAMSSKLGTALKIGLATAATTAAVAVGKTVKDAVAGFADYEQLTGGVETLFKSSADDVIYNAQQAFRTAQLSANEYMQTVTSFSASLLQGLGGDTAKAADYADQAIIDMADNANKMGTDIGMIQNAYQGFAKQNYMMLDNLKLGYGGTKTEMERLISDANKVKKANGEMANLSIDSFADVTEAIHIIQTELGITGTSAEEADKTISGSLNSMKSSWQNLLVAMADTDVTDGALDLFIDDFTKTVSNFGKNILPVIEKALFGIAQLIVELGPVIVEMLPGLIDSILPPLLEAVVKITAALIEVLPDLLLSIIRALIDALPMLVDAVIEVANILTQPSNLQLILNAGIQLLMQLVNALPQILTSLINALPTIIDNIVQFLTDPNNIMLIAGAAAQLFFGIVKAVPQILGSLLDAFGSLVGSLWNGITRMFGEFAGNFGNFISGIFKNAINGVLSFIESFINGPIDVINGFIDIINNALGAIGVNLGHIGRVNLPRLATGGIVEATAGGRVILAGEGGEDEWVVPESKMASLIDQLNDRMGGAGGDTFNFTFNGVIGTPSELREYSVKFHDAYEQVNKQRFANA